MPFTPSRDAVSTVAAAMTRAVMRDWEATATPPAAADTGGTPPVLFPDLPAPATAPATARQLAPLISLRLPVEAQPALMAVAQRPAPLVSLSAPVQQQPVLAPAPISTPDPALGDASSVVCVGERTPGAPQADGHGWSDDDPRLLRLEVPFTGPASRAASVSGQSSTSVSTEPSLPEPPAVRRVNTQKALAKLQKPLKKKKPPRKPGTTTAARFRRWLERRDGLATAASSRGLFASAAAPKSKKITRQQAAAMVARLSRPSR